jgi:carboxypeptidase C (cathepsin A)
MFQFICALLSAASLFAAEKTTTHKLKLEEEPINYTAIVSSGGVSYIAYIKQTTENRPITFAFNGGPGSSSAWLHMATLGPRRLVPPEEGQSITPPYKIVDNRETILDLTDLVFIDPSGTGFSSTNDKAYSVKGDIESVGKFIREYLTQNKRWNSPKYIAGESYGALRAAGLGDYLQDEFGIYLNGLILISAAIDYQTFIFDQDNALPYFLYFPTYAATAWYHGKYRPEASLEEVVKEARDFVYSTYSPFLICPKSHKKEFIHERLSEMSGLRLEIINLCSGRINSSDFTHYLLLDEKKMVGRFDSRITGYYNIGCQDPSDSNIGGIMSAALHDYLHKELDFQDSYALFSSNVHKQWKFNSHDCWGYPNLMSGLRRALLSNPSMKIFVGCGYFDLATPFATAEYCIDHLDIPNTSIQMEYYEGGHMYYLNPSARIKFKQDLIRFYNPQGPLCAF